jgi:hypothetical protein
MFQRFQHDLETSWKKCCGWTGFSSPPISQAIWCLTIRKQPSSRRASLPPTHIHMIIIGGDNPPAGSTENPPKAQPPFPSQHMVTGPFPSQWIVAGGFPSHWIASGVFRELHQRSACCSCSLCCDQLTYRAISFFAHQNNRLTVLMTSRKARTTQRTSTPVADVNARGRQPRAALLVSQPKELGGEALLIVPGVERDWA